MVDLPTGEESPKGFEEYFADKKAKAERGIINIDCLSATQLAPSEIAELDNLRTKALANFEKTTGHKASKETIEDEINRVPSSRELSDKLIFRAFYKDQLVAYCHVICGWPRAYEWTIEQLLLHPEHRLQGIGTKLIQEVERLAETAEVRATQILSIPNRPKSDTFWKTIGYEDKTSEFEENISDTYGYMNIMRKKLK